MGHLPWTGSASTSATDEQIEAAAAARLLPWIRSLPHGWDTPVGTHGEAVPAANGNVSRWPARFLSTRRC